MTRAMKESGVEWIGQIPEQWEIGKVKKIFIRKKEKAKQENPTILSLARNGIRVRDISTNEGQIADSYFEYNPVKQGDLLLNPMDLISGANCNLSNIDGVISPAYINLRVNGEFSAKYFDFYFKCQYWSKAFFAHGKGVSYENRWTLNNETLMNYPIPLPPADETTKIAAFLEGKTAHIDSIISQTKESIEAFKSYKQALITETVTKGLNPDVKMKDSGIAWIGEIPEHWNISPLKYILTERSVKSKTGEEEPLSMSQKYGLIKTRDMDLIPNMTNSYVGNKIVEKNDLVFNKLKAHLGVFSVSNYEGIVSPDYAVYYSKKEVNVKFLEYVFKTSNYIVEFKKRSRGIAAGLTRLYTSDLFAIKCGIPCLKEQNEIVDYINQKSLLIDSLINEKQQIIAEFEDYKKSLIYEYVTGKKEV